jgi:hypothetical protein
MIESGSRARLALEALGRGTVLQIIGEHLHRDHPPEPRVFGLVNHSHAPCTEGFKDSIMRDGPADHEA